MPPLNAYTRFLLLGIDFADNMSAMPHSPLMNPIGAGEWAAWASLYIHFLWCTAWLHGVTAQHTLYVYLLGYLSLASKLFYEETFCLFMFFRDILLTSSDKKQLHQTDFFLYQTKMIYFM
jgi:hypothetical protein